jgi:NAD(P)-dependent dehydrogenase (short-subunit alcohol dehydrogenase family)
MDMQLQGRKVLVTGASRGIGFGIASEFAREGCDLVLVARSQEALDGAADRIRSDTGRSVATLALPLGDPGAAETLAARFPDIDVLVNNAGAIPGGSLQDVGEQAWRESWDLKVFGYIFLARAYLPLMRARPDGGVIVNIIGAAGEMLDPAYIAGSVGNAALIAFTKAVGGSSIEQNVRMVGINPGPVATDRHQSILRRRAQAQFGDAERWTELLAALPYGRAAQVDEIAAMAVMLASPRSAYTSGAVVAIDGGLTQRRRPVG